MAASSTPTSPDPSRQPRISRRLLLAGTGASAVGAALSSVFAFPAQHAAVAAAADHPAMPRPWTPTIPALAVAGSSRTIRPPAGLTVLIDPNRAMSFTICFPLASQGGVASTVLLPVASAAASARIWRRVVHFQQPFTGSAVDPKLRVAGQQPTWGAAGNGSTDIVSLVSTNRRDWAISDHVSVRRDSSRSILDTTVGAPPASTDPMSLPNPILEWSAADMRGATADGAAFAPGSRVGHDLSGSGNDLITSPGELMTFRAGPVLGTPRIPCGLAGFPYVTGSPAGGGVGCSFAGGPVTAWTVLVAFAANGQTDRSALPEQMLFRTRAVRSGGSVSFALKYGNMGYTWDGSSFNNLLWAGHPFTNAAGHQLPAVVGLAATGGQRSSAPTILGGSVASSLARAGSGDQNTDFPSAIGGFDFPTASALCGVLVFAAALSVAQLEQAALRLAYVGYGQTS